MSEMNEFNTAYIISQKMYSHSLSLEQKEPSSDELKRLAKCLRYGSSEEKPDQAPVMCLSDISRILGVSSTQVHRWLLTTKNSHHDPRHTGSKRRAKLTPEHISYLVREDTLTSQAEMTLAERAIVFHRHFPETKISAPSISQVYKKHGIRKKAIVIHKSIPVSRAERAAAQLLLMKSEVIEAQRQRRTLVFIDECMFTISSVLTKAYSARRSNITIHEAVASQEAVALLGGVSAQKGLEGYLMRERSIDSQAFISFLENLFSVRAPRRLALFMDNCSVHHSKRVKEYMRSRGVMAIYNVPYSPQFNPIEKVWAQVKRIYKKEKLSLMTKGIRVDSKKLIQKSLLAVDPGVVRSICRKITDNNLLKD